MSKTLATSHPVHCTESRRPNGSAFSLARIDVTGIFLWCKLCRKEHALSRVALCAIWDELEEQSHDIIAKTGEFVMSDIAGHSPDEHWDKKGSRMKPPNYEADLASAFPLRYDSPAIRPTQPQGGSAISHEHLWRVVISEGTSIRWCERCSKSYKLMGERSTVKWIEINE